MSDVMLDREGHVLWPSPPTLSKRTYRRRIFSVLIGDPSAPINRGRGFQDPYAVLYEDLANGLLVADVSKYELWVDSLMAKEDSDAAVPSNRRD